MPPIQKPKPNFITKAAEKVKAASPFPDWLNNAVLPTDQSLDVAGIPAGGAIEPAVSAGASLLSPLVSLYKNKAEREAATQAFYESFKEFGRKFMPRGEQSALVQAAKDLTETHPRVAAHMKADVGGPVGGASGYSSAKDGGFAAAMNWHPIANRVGPGEVLIHNNAIPGIDARIPEARRILRHEATHAAQALGDPRVPELYDLAHQAVGYERNPYEVGARYGETAATTNAKSSAALPTSIYQQQINLARKLKDLGISMDTHSIGSLSQISLRKWGAEKLPENMVDMKTLPEPLRSKLEALSKALMSPNRTLPTSGFTRATSPGKASDTVRQILETRRTGSPITTHAYNYLAKRTRKP